MGKTWGEYNSLMIAALALLANCCSRAPGVEAHRYWLWNDAATPVSVIVYRAARPLPAHVTILLDAWDSTGIRRDSTWTADGNAPGAAFAGVVTTSGALARDCWRLTVEDAGGVGGCAPRRDDGEVSLSDLVMTDSEGVVWRGTTIVAASDTIDGDRPHGVFYQVRGAVEHPHGRTTLTLTDVTDPRRGRRLLQIAFDDHLAPGINQFTRNLDVTRLPRGRYLLELQVGDLDGAGASVRSMNFVVR